MGKQIQSKQRTKKAIGYTYPDWGIESKGGTVIHSAIWNSVGAFKQMNPNTEPAKVRITIENV